jgi:hypothetical protein
MKTRKFLSIAFMVLVFEQLHSLKKMVGGYNNVLKKYVENAVNLKIILRLLQQ